MCYLWVPIYTMMHASFTQVSTTHGERVERERGRRRGGEELGNGRRGRRREEVVRRGRDNPGNASSHQTLNQRSFGMVHLIRSLNFDSPQYMKLKSQIQIHVNKQVDLTQGM